MQASPSKARFGRMTFPKTLEQRFEQDTRQRRARRMWTEGLVAILAFNGCLLLDYFLLGDTSWSAIVTRTALVTPISLAVNEIVRRNPPKWLREGSVAAGMFLICLINLLVEGQATAVTTLLGSFCLLISALFVGVVMRLRFPYVLATVSAMLFVDVCCLADAPALRRSESVMAASMVLIGIAIILLASASLESEERKSYLLSLERDLQTSELAWANQALMEASNVDELTRLPNRRALEERVTLLWQTCTNAGDPLSAILIDVDHFKSVNDVYGHLFGDETLRHIGALLPKVTRNSGDMAARFGGEEFVLLLPHTDADSAIAVAERIRYLIQATEPPNPSPRGKPNSFRVTVSCGVSTCLPGGKLTWNHVLFAADKGLYEAKRKGRNRVEFIPCDEPVSRQSRPGEHPSRLVRRISGLRQAFSRSSGHTSAQR